MKIFVMRHGEAEVIASSDEARHLNNYGRKQSISQGQWLKNHLNSTALLAAPLTLEDDKERALAIKLLQFEEAVQTVGKEGTPHVLCTYLYELAGIFSSFYEHCPILNAEDEAVKLSRLKLALLTEKTLKQGLELLGIKTVEKM